MAVHLPCCIATIEKRDDGRAAMDLHRN